MTKRRAEPGVVYQIEQARSYRRIQPLWVRNEKKVAALILRSFPKAKTNKGQREAAARWASVIHLYYRMGYTRSQIAHEIGSTETKVSGIIRSITRVSKGLRADGSGKLASACPTLPAVVEAP